MQMQIVYVMQMRNVSANCKCNMYARLGANCKFGKFWKSWKFPSKLEKNFRKWEKMEVAGWGG